MLHFNKVKLQKPSFIKYTDYTYDVDSVYVNDDNEEYCVNDGSWTTQNSEIYVDKGKDTLLITVGESWTYGEGSEKINHRLHRWDLVDRIEIPYGGKMARILDCDYYTFARPGNSNSGIYTGLFRMLNNIPRGRYKSIKVLIQMTDVGRDQLNFLPKDHKLWQLQSWHLKLNLHISDWLKTYEEVFLDELENKIKQHSDLPLDVVVFKNFNHFFSDKNYSFRICRDMCWLKHNAYYCGVDFPTTHVMTPGYFYEGLIKAEILKDLDMDWVENDIAKWDNVAKFMTTENEVNHSSHPTELSQSLWSQYLLHYTGWV